MITASLNESGVADVGVGMDFNFSSDKNSEML
jgi:hypothetical protein